MDFTELIEEQVTEFANKHGIEDELTVKMMLSAAYIGSTVTSMKLGKASNDEIRSEIRKTKNTSIKSQKN